MQGHPPRTRTRNEWHTTAGVTTESCQERESARGVSSSLCTIEQVPRADWAGWFLSDFCRRGSYSVCSIQLQRVVLNLVMKKIEAMQSVHLRVKSERSSSPDAVRVSVEDNGTGVDATNLDQIFKPLFTIKERGMGMGCPSAARSLPTMTDGFGQSPGLAEGQFCSLNCR
jgi:hypothetical protein